MHQSAGRLPVPGCTNNHGYHLNVNKPSTLMTHVAFTSKLRLVVRPYMHPCPGNLMTVGLAVVMTEHLVQELNVGTVHQYDTECKLVWYLEGDLVKYVYTSIIFYTC